MRRLLGSLVVLGALASATGAASAASAVEVAVPDRAAAAAVPVRGGTALERRAVRTALALLGGRVLIRSVRIAPTPRHVLRGRMLVIDAGYPRSSAARRTARMAEAAWQAELVAGEVRRRLVGSGPPVTWVDIPGHLGHQLTVRRPAPRPDPSTRARLGADLAAAATTARFADARVRVLPIGGAALRLDARLDEAQLLGPQTLVAPWAPAASGLLLLRRPDGAVLGVSGAAVETGMGSGWTPRTVPADRGPLPTTWAAPLHVRVATERLRRDGSVRRTVRRISCPTAATGPRCRALRADRWTLFWPFASGGCSLMPLPGSVVGVEVSATVGGVRLERAFEQCGRGLGAWADLLAL